MTEELQVLRDVLFFKLPRAEESLSERQLSDVEDLIASGFNLEYLRGWSVELNLTDMLTRVLQ